LIKVLAAIIRFLMPVFPAIRARLMQRKARKAVTFGVDKREFLIIPFVALYFYTVLAINLGWPHWVTPAIFNSETLGWVGIAAGITGLIVLATSIVAFGDSFRIGIDEGTKDSLVTSGIFAVTRNPIYVAFALVLLCQLLVFQTWFFLIYLIAATLLFHRQVLLEEKFLEQRYGKQFDAYRKKVRRYI
jgi:protein-S-isoprenylcysteine O-methyltransferase Ste14